MADASAPAAATPVSSPDTAPQSTPDIAASQAPGTPGAAPVAAPTKAEVKRIKSLMLKVDGAEVNEPLPFEMDDTPENREYMTRQLQMAKMGTKRGQEAADLRKQVDGIRDYLGQAKGNKTQLRKLIKELGGDEKELAAMIIEEEIANSQKSPELLAKEKAEAELKEFKDQREKEKAEFNARELERHQTQEMERYDVLVSQALEKSGLPKKAHSVRRMTDYMLLALENGVDLHPDEVAKIVEQEMHGDIQEIIQALGEDKAESWIGKDILTKIRKKNVAKAKLAGGKPAGTKAPDVGSVSAPKDAAPVVKKSIKALWGV